MSGTFRERFLRYAIQRLISIAESTATPQAPMMTAKIGRDTPAIGDVEEREDVIEDAGAVNEVAIEEEVAVLDEGCKLYIDIDIVVPRVAVAVTRAVLVLIAC
jgi:hypothetical protein